MKNLFHIVVLLLLSGMVVVSSCKKTPKPTVAEIRVLTKDGAPLPYADIVLRCTSSVNIPCEIEIFAKADAKGVYTREFDLPKVLLITASGNLRDTVIYGTLPDTTMVITKDTVCGTSTISIKPEETSVQKVIVYDCK